MTAQELDELAAEHWSIEPHDRDEPHMHIISESGPYRFRILRNVNLEGDEMQAITALPELFALALAVVRGADGEQVREMARVALEKANGQSDA